MSEPFLFEVGNLPPPEEIQADIDKLVSSKGRCRENRKQLARGMRSLRKEKKELEKLVEKPGTYSVEALQANVERLDKDVVRVKAVRDAEDQKIEEYDRIIEILEDRKWRSEVISQLTGS